MKKLIWATVAIVCAAVSIWLGLDQFLTDRYATSFEPRYLTPTAFDPDANLLLKEDVDASTLLITAHGRSEVFSFDSTKREVMPVESNQWNNSRAIEINCGEQSILDEYSGDHYGNYLLSVKTSLDQTFIAVLSAYGPRGPAIEILPNLGGPGKILGTRYLEIRRLVDNELIGKPIRINIQSDVLQPSLCWTATSRYLTVHDQANSISIVDLRNR